MRKLLAGVAIGVGSAAVVLLLGYAGWLDVAELKTYDWRMRTVSSLRQRGAQPFVHPDIVLVEINDAAIADLAPVVGRWPWPRFVHAWVIDFLARARPKVIAFDVGFWEEERPGTYDIGGSQKKSTESDQDLADAVRRAGNVILLADAVPPRRTDPDTIQRPWDAPPFKLSEAIEQRPVIVPPYEALSRAASGLGHNFVAVDPDGPVRRFAPFVRQGDRYMPSLGLAAALAALGTRADSVALEGDVIHVGDRRIPLVPIDVPADRPGQRYRQLTMLINYLAPGSVNGARPYPTYGANQLVKSEDQLLSGQQPLIDPALFRDKIVFIGTTGAGLFDVFQTPFGEGSLPGIQLHASVTDSVLSNRFLRPAAAWSVVAITAAGALAIGLMSAGLAFSVAALGTLALTAGWLAASVFAFQRGVSAGVVQPLAAMAVALFAGTAYRYFVEDAEKRRVSRLFGRYVSKDVHAQLLANPGLAELGGKRRVMTVLFSDIRGFTSVTEKGDPEELVAQLNEYFSSMVDIVFRHKGTVDKFVGDMVMALFGAPLDDVDHAEHAVAAAVEMVRELGELNAKWTREGRAALDIGIGVNSGEMIAGNIGSSSIMSYTVIGDHVNLGSRLESLNKEYRTRIIISDATRQQLKAPFEIRPLGGVVVKGKTRPVEIFEVKVPSPLVATEAPAKAEAAKETTI